MIETFLKQWEVVMKAPLIILPALFVLAALIGAAEYRFFKANMDRKDDLIATLKEQLMAAKDTAAKARDTADKLVVAALRPELKLAMSGGNVFLPDIPDSQNFRAGLAIDATAWNTGAPSVATAWSLVVIPQGKKPVLAQLTKMPDQIRASGPINSGVIRGSEALDIKTKKEPIQNIPVDGTLLFYVSLEQKVVLEPTTILELSVKDIYGTESLVRQVMGDWWHR
jgi:hypothetical protein